ncbi:MAG: hypothetical protein M1840_001181 [Geoglossum simile]|nr:MAG: hypothetical protein M1840_001181 [Geoglossum simile]
MEHLLAPEGAKAINIPYVGVEEYRAYSDDSLIDFKSYFERKAWKRDSAGDLIFGDRTPREIVAFLQTWLYFGCLISVFRRVEIDVQTCDFLRVSERGEVLVCTKRLPEFIAEWVRRESFRDESDEPFSPKRMRGENIKEALHWTFWYSGMFDREAKEDPKIPNDPLPLVRLSIMAMGESLCSALVAIYGYEASAVPIWGPSPILRDRLRDSGWCTSDSPFFPASLPKTTISADYYFGGCACPRPRGHHRDCSEAICHAYQKVIDTKTYTPKHASTCDGGCGHVLAPDEIVDIVRKGGIPMISWRGETMSVSTFTSPTKYVAISHVWSDGLGNDDVRNSLPTCQLSLIQDLVDQLYTARHRSPNYGYLPDKDEDELVGFWIDTLCVPVGKENSAIRTSAIRQMGNIYRQADRVLVLDSFIQELPHTASTINKYTRLHLSNWHHRLWTLQEGQLAKTLFFQFKDGAETFYDIRYSERNIDHKDAAHICSPVRHLCTTELEAFYRYFEDSTATGDITTRMRSCAKYLRSRQTSRMEDEPLCVSTILDLDPSQLLTRATAEDRMANFYDLIRSFDPRIIFNDHPRLRTDGYRWAPRSFLQQLPDLVTMAEGGMTPSPVALIPNSGGLPVQFPGFEIHNAGPHLGSSIFVVPKTDTVPWAQQSRPQSSRAIWWDQWYRLQLVPDENGGFPTWNPELRYAVISYSNLGQDSLPSPAIIGIIETSQQPSDENAPPTMTAPRMDPKLAASLANDKRRLWWSLYEVPQRITIRYICRAHIDLPAPETVTDAKEKLGHHLQRETQGNFAAFIKKQLQKAQWVGGQREPAPPQQVASEGMYPVWATVYGETQKWCVW